MILKPEVERLFRGEFVLMRHLIMALVLLVVLVPGTAHAKRKPAPTVEPVIYGGVRYIVPNDNGRRAYIQAWDTKTNKMVWEVTVFRNFINPLIEEDVQWVFIAGMKIQDGRLLVRNENGRTYRLDLETGRVQGAVRYRLPWLLGGVSLVLVIVFAWRRGWHRQGCGTANGG